MKKKDFYTTGEVASILHVTRATVSRKFDHGELEGKKNPVTSDRLISHDSLLQFLKENHIPDPFRPEKKSTLVISDQPSLLNVLQNIAQKIDSVSFTYCTFTTDALICCGRQAFDIIILDHRTKDLNTKHFRNSLERMNMFHSSTILHLLTDKSPDEFQGHMNEFALHCIDTDESNLKSLLHRLLFALPEDLTGKRWSNRYYHSRQSQRYESSVPVDFIIFNKDSSESVRGTGIISNISTDGAWISDLQCENTENLLSCFTLHIDAISGKHLTSHLTAEIVRLSRSRNLCAGVHFTASSAASKKEIRNIIKNASLTI